MVLKKLTLVALALAVGIGAICRSVEWGVGSNAWEGKKLSGFLRASSTPTKTASYLTHSSSVLDPNHQEAFAEYAKDIRGAARSGIGSMPYPEFTKFLNSFLADKKPGSILEVSSGHWPSGWQTQGVRWPKADYLGLDITPAVINEDMKMLEDIGDNITNQFGLKTMQFKVGDMISDDLPRAEMLLTKDTLIHLPNALIEEFLKRNILVDPPKYKYVMFVHDMDDAGSNVDIPIGQFHKLDLTKAPFKVPDLKNVFSYQANNPKVVQLLEFSNWQDYGQAERLFKEW